MFKTLYYSLKIDTFYAINSFIYTLRGMPFIKDVLSEEILNSKALKVISGLIGVVLTAFKMFISRFIYFLVLYYISLFLFKETVYFDHVFLIFSLIGLFINNKLLNTSVKKYLAISVFNMNAKDYLKYNLFWICLTNFILNMFYCYLFGFGIIHSLYLVILQISIRIVGEAFNIWYFRRKNNFWYNNTILYFSILGLLLACLFLPFTGVFVGYNVIKYFTYIFILFGVFSYTYINSFNDYKVIHKRLNSLKNAVEKDDVNSNYFVEVKDKDIKINNKKLDNKNGYDYFNIIFFERHKDILLRSSRNTSVVLIFIYAVLSYIVCADKIFASDVSYFLTNRLGVFVLLMYFINRGSVVTRAMFYNCDHAMLKYNFYRESNVIVGLFKKRLKTIIEVNLLPAFVVGIGNIVLLIITGNFNLLSLSTMFLFIILLSVFFSLHHLVMYYLLQPYDEDMKIKKLSFSICNVITYLLAFYISKFILSSFSLSIFGLVLCIIYMIFALKLVEKYAPITFKINK